MEYLLIIMMFKGMILEPITYTNKTECQEMAKIITEDIRYLGYGTAVCIKRTKEQNND